MKRLLVATTVLALISGAGMSGAAVAQTPLEQGQREVQNRIANVNGQKIQLSGGTVVQVPETVATEGDLKEGRMVKVKFEVKDGQNVATSLEFPEETRPGDRK